MTTWNFGEIVMVSMLISNGSNASMSIRLSMAERYVNDRTIASPATDEGPPASVADEDPGLLRLEPQVLVRAGEREAGDEPEAGLLDAPAVAAHRGELEDRREHRLV